MEDDVIMQKTDNNLIPKTFFWMFLGLLGTAGVAWYTYASGLWVNLVITNYFQVILILEVVVVLLFSFLFKKLPPVAVAILYFVYSLLNGVTLSTLFAYFELNSIIILFGISAILFALFAIIGYVSKIDFSKWYNLLFGTMLAALVLSIINIFLGNSILDIALDWVILFVFFGVTAYDMNSIKQLQYDETMKSDKLYIYGAMQLYLDFINIFLRILSLFGKRKD
jgi:FtsH-binding integral membrane protein